MTGDIKQSPNTNTHDCIVHLRGPAAFLSAPVQPDKPAENKYTYCISAGSGNGKSLNLIQHIVPAGFSYSSPESHEMLSCQR